MGDGAVYGERASKVGGQVKAGPEHRGRDTQSAGRAAEDPPRWWGLLRGHRQGQGRVRGREAAGGRS